MDNCLFCKIIAGKIPCKKIYEDDSVFAFLDINPTSKGHTLVIPKKHSTNLVDMDYVDLQECISVCKKLGPKLMEDLGATGFNLGQNNFEDAGQVIMHTHFHIIPRFSDDGYEFTWAKKEYDEGEAEKLAEKIKGKF